MGQDPLDFVPILEPGFHFFTVPEARARFVSAFTTSRTRPAIFDHLEAIVRRFTRARFTGEIWLNGSFVTEKLDPDDLDLLVRVSSDQYKADESIRAAVEWATDPERQTSHRCDGYRWVEYSLDHPLFRRRRSALLDSLVWYEPVGRAKGNCGYFLTREFPMSVLLELQDRIAEARERVRFLEAASVEHPSLLSIAANLDSAVRVLNRLEAEYRIQATKLGASSSERLAELPDDGRRADEPVLTDVPRLTQDAGNDHLSAP